MTDPRPHPRTPSPRPPHRPRGAWTACLAALLICLTSLVPARGQATAPADTGIDPAVARARARAAAAASQPSATTAPAPIATPTPEPVDPDKLRASVSGGLDWLVAQQVRSGPDAGGWEGGNYPTAAASLAGLAFLAHGHLPHEPGPYGQAVERAMAHVRQSMTPDGYLGERGNSMYVHAICTLFGVSYLGLSREPQREVELSQWCKRAIDVIVQSQRVRKQPSEQGGWRYSPSTDESDLSVSSWQLLALLAARQCGYEVDQEVIDSALRYFNSACQESGDSVGFLYRPGITKDPEPGVTGVAIAVKTLFERPADPRLPRAVNYLRRFPPAWGGQQYKGFYYSVNFYLVQGFFQLGPAPWGSYGPAVQRILIEHQSGDGHWPFPPDGELEARATSPAYATAMALLMLGMDNQFLPMYQRQAELFGGSR
ncbi:MAG: terpene cyclase/mutase family protein [Planctomycetota bacterium]|nr:terpene cyclase/mutase family protein [Planctomycetota bacterium]